MVLVENSLGLFDFVFAHPVQLQIYEGLTKETKTNETQQYFETRSYNHDRRKKLKMRAHLRMTSLLCILLSVELLCWLLNLEEMYLSRASGNRK